MKKLITFISCFIAIAFINLSYSGGVPSSGDVDDGNGFVPVDLKDPDRIEAGKATFHSTCADYCHGHEPALFIGRGDELEPEYIYKTIFEGGKGATPMPPWGEVFDEEEIWELVSYIKFLGTQ